MRSPPRLDTALLRRAAALLLGLSGCAAPPTPPAEPLARPPLVVAARHFAGTPLSGPLPSVPPDDKFVDAWDVRVTLVGLERMPSSMPGLLPLGSRARLVTASRGSAPILASPRLGRGSALLEVDDAGAFLSTILDGSMGRAVSVAKLDGVLLPGVTAAFDAQRSADAGRIVTRRDPGRFEIQICLGEPLALQVSLLLEGFPPPAMKGEEKVANAMAGNEPEAGASPRPVEELVLLDRRSKGNRDQLALFFPSPLEGGDVRAFVAVIEASANGKGDPAREAEHARTLDRCKTDLAMSAKLVARPPVPARFDASDWPGITSALRALSSSFRQRNALEYLASVAGASVAEDFALTGSDAHVAELSAAVLKKVEGPSPPGDLPSLAWALERSGLEIAAKLLEANQIGPELEATLVRYAGQSGRDSASLSEALRGAKNLKELEDHFVNENWIFLEDVAPPARARAFDWLTARKEAPEGYDPLAPARERRIALEKAAAARVEAAEAKEKQ